MTDPLAEPQPGAAVVPFDHDQTLVAIVGLRHDLLRATDRAVGAEAELDYLRRLNVQLTADVDREVSRARKLTAERDRLRKDIAAMRASTTWRAGRLLVRPAARLRRRRGRQ
ncbi:MAG: hypothetical protein ACR2LX_14790 [Jatrophihabitans sp.]